MTFLSDLSKSMTSLTFHQCGTNLIDFRQYGKDKKGRKTGSFGEDTVQLVGFTDYVDA